MVKSVYRENSIKISKISIALKWLDWMMIINEHFKSYARIRETLSLRLSFLSNTKQ